MWDRGIIFGALLGQISDASGRRHNPLFCIPRHTTPCGMDNVQPGVYS